MCDIIQDIPLPKVFNREVKSYIKMSFDTRNLTTGIECQVVDGVVKMYQISKVKMMSKMMDKIIAHLKTKK